MADGGLTADELAAWLTPDEALILAAKAIGDDKIAANAIAERLKGGVIRAAAKSSAWELDDRAAPPTSIVLIPIQHWTAFSRATRELEFWQAGQVRFFFGGADARRISQRVTIGREVFAPQRIVIRYFGVRLNAEDVYAWLAEFPSQQPDPAEAPQRARVEVAAATTLAPDVKEAPRGPPVSDVHLRLWRDLYLKVYVGASDTLPNALASARGMFPGKFVARDRVRKLLEGRKPGKKSKDVSE